jgi:hypothetical protein
VLRTGLRAKAFAACRTTSEFGNVATRRIVAQLLHPASFQGGRPALRTTDEADDCLHSQPVQDAHPPSRAVQDITAPRSINARLSPSRVDPRAQKAAKNSRYRHAGDPNKVKNIVVLTTIYWLGIPKTTQPLRRHDTSSSRSKNCEIDGEGMAYAVVRCIHADS